MQKIQTLNDIVDAVKAGKTKTVAVAAGQDPDTILAITRAVSEGVVKAVLVGDEKAISEVAASKDINLNHFRIVNESNALTAARKAVEIVNKGDADMVMKGLVKTGDYMKAIFNKQTT